MSEQLTRISQCLLKAEQAPFKKTWLGLRLGLNIKLKIKQNAFVEGRKWKDFVSNPFETSGLIMQPSLKVTLEMIKYLRKVVKWWMEMDIDLSK